MVFISCADAQLKYQGNVIIALGFYEIDFSPRAIIYYDEASKTIRREIANEHKFIGKIER